MRERRLASAAPDAGTNTAHLVSEPADHVPRRTVDEFDAMYAGAPPWDIGRPQPAFLALATAGKLRGTVLDVGCGTGEHALMAAERGLTATGVDTAPSAIAIAQRKAAERGLAVRFAVFDALDLGRLDERFDTLLDSGLFHVFDDHDRARYVESLAAATAPGSVYHMLCFSDREPGDWGPRRVSKAEIEASFATGWRIETLEPAVFETTLETGDVDGWRAEIVRT